MARSVLCVVALFGLIVVAATLGLSDASKDKVGEYKDPIVELYEALGPPAQYPDVERRDFAKRIPCKFANPGLCSGSYGKRRFRSTAD